MTGKTDARWGCRNHALGAIVPAQANGVGTVHAARLGPWLRGWPTPRLGTYWPLCRRIRTLVWLPDGTPVTCRVCLRLLARLEATQAP